MLIFITFYISDYKVVPNCLLELFIDSIRLGQVLNSIKTSSKFGTHYIKESPDTWLHQFCCFQGAQVNSTKTSKQQGIAFSLTSYTQMLMSVCLRLSKIGVV